MMDFIAGALTFAFILAGIFFLRFWKQTHDRLFVHFALAFGLFALNQFGVTWVGAQDERLAYVYLLRVLGYALILFAIVDKNIFSLAKRK